MPPCAPPEQDDIIAVSTFEVFTGALGGTAALAIRLVPCAGTVDVAGEPDIFVGRNVTTTAAGTGWIALIFAEGKGNATSEPFGYAAIVAASLHSLPVASIPPPAPPEHTWACSGAAKAATRKSIGNLFMETP